MIKVSTRLVIVIGHYAIKIPLDKRGWLQGINEAYLWKKYPNQGKLVPMVWGWKGLVIQRRAYPLKDFKTKYAEILKREIWELNISNCDLYNPKNWGVYKGNVVLLDYGITERVSTMY